MTGNVKNVMAAIDYIESRLSEKLDLDLVAGAAHYSKYHLHRMFKDTAGMTVQTYIRRRRLTEAARLLVFSDRPILEIALSSGYESQQSFSDIFKAMYKKSPHRYREERKFYPLQLKHILNENLTNTGNGDWQDKIVFAEKGDIPEWMRLVRLAVDGFPHLDENQHLQQLWESIGQRRALMIKEAGTAVGIMAFQEMTGRIDFLGVHPQYRSRGIAKAFCSRALRGLTCTGQISVTTFREGDKADTGHREGWKSLGFAEAELLVEFGYPTQRFLLREPPLLSCRREPGNGETEAGENG